MGGVRVKDGVKGEKCGLLDSPGSILTCNSHRMSWAHLKSTQLSVEGQTSS